VSTGVIASTSGSATLELAGSVSSLGTAVAGHRATIQNDSSAPAGLLVTGTNQQVGPVDGAGNTQVNAGASLTADHIIQSALAIDGDATHPALVTIAASNPSGNLLSATGPLTESDTISVIAQSLVGSPAPPAGSSFASSRNPPAGESTVPEPSALLLAAVGIAAAFACQCCRRSSRPCP
jgi:hypothetical protein